MAYQRFSGGTGANQTEDQGSGLIQMFKPNVDTIFPSAKKVGLRVRIMPAFDENISGDLPEFKTSWMPYRHAGRINPETEHEYFTKWAETIRAFRFFGKSESSFISPATKGMLMDAPLPQDKACPIHDLRKWCSKQDQFKHLCEADDDNNSGGKGYKKAVLPNSQRIGVFNCLYVHQQQTTPKPSLMCLTDGGMIDLRAQLNWPMTMDPAAQQNGDGYWPNYLLGDVTAPYRGGVANVVQKQIANMQAKPWGLQYTSHEQNIKGFIPMPIGVEQLAARYDFLSPEVLYIPTYQEVVEFLYADGMLPRELIAYACGSQANVSTHQPPSFANAVTGFPGAPVMGGGMPGMGVPAMGMPAAPAMGMPAAPSMGGMGAPAMGMPAQPAMGGMPGMGAPAMGMPAAPAMGGMPGMGSMSGMGAPAMGMPAQPAMVGVGMGVGVPSMGGMPGGMSAPAMAGVGMGGGMPGMGAPAMGGMGAPAMGGMGAPAMGGMGAPAMGMPNMGGPAMGAPSMGLPQSNAPAPAGFVGGGSTPGFGASPPGDDIPFLNGQSSTAPTTAAPVQNAMVAPSPAAPVVQAPAKRYHVAVNKQPQEQFPTGLTLVEIHQMAPAGADILVWDIDNPATGWVSLASVTPVPAAQQAAPPAPGLPALNEAVPAAQPLAPLSQEELEHFHALALRVKTDMGSMVGPDILLFGQLQERGAAHGQIKVE